MYTHNSGRIKDLYRELSLHHPFFLKGASIFANFLTINLKSRTSEISPMVQMIRPTKKATEIVNISNNTAIKVL